MMATDVVRDVDPFAHSKKVQGWTLRKTRSPRRWAPDLGNGTYVREARTPSGLLTFRVVFPNGKLAHRSTLAEAQEYAEQWAAQNGVH